ncbi:MAG: hypothetical protein CL910_15320 [Deltaproteobacteria bacterium]|jgi:hypothetical protein|nr:hypothetical protein [Deltaproteobacteria bacterium]
MVVPKNVEPRFKKRIPCRLKADGSTTMVLNVSRGGLFVQTSAVARPGDPVRVYLSPGDSDDPIEIDARVVWKRVVSQQLRSIAKTGVGLEIRNAAASYFEFLVGVASREPVAADPEPPAPTQPGAAGPLLFRVRARRANGPRTRIFSVEARDLEDARRKADARCGSEWRILELSPNHSGSR